MIPASQPGWAEGPLLEVECSGKPPASTSQLERAGKWRKERKVCMEKRDNNPEKRSKEEKKGEMEADKQQWNEEWEDMWCWCREREVEKVNLEQECKRNVRNGLFLWLETETEGGQEVLPTSTVVGAYFNQIHRWFKNDLHRFIYHLLSSQVNQI